MGPCPSSNNQEVQNYAHKIPAQILKFDRICINYTGSGRPGPTLAGYGLCGFGMRAAVVWRLTLPFTLRTLWGEGLGMRELGWMFSQAASTSCCKPHLQTPVHLDLHNQGGQPKAAVCKNFHFQSSLWNQSCPIEAHAIGLLEGCT